MNSKPKRRKKQKMVKAWMAESPYEVTRGYSYLHFSDKAPEVDADYRVYPIWVTERKP